MALFRNLCACPVKCGAYFSGVNLRNYLTLRKIANFCIGNLICAQYRFMDEHELGFRGVWERTMGLTFFLHYDN